MKEYGGSRGTVVRVSSARLRRVKRVHCVEMINRADLEIVLSARRTLKSRPYVNYDKNAKYITRGSKRKRYTEGYPAVLVVVH